MMIGFHSADNSGDSDDVNGGADAHSSSNSSGFRDDDRLSGGSNADSRDGSRSYKQHAVNRGESSRQQNLMFRVDQNKKKITSANRIWKSLPKVISEMH